MTVTSRALHVPRRTWLLRTFLLCLACATVTSGQSLTVDPRQEHTATLIGNTIYFVGGSSDRGEPITDHVALDASKSFATKSPPYRRISSKNGPHTSGHIAVQNGRNGKQIVVFGGVLSSGSATSHSLFVYDTTTNRWSNPRVDDEPARREGHTGVVNAAGYMYLYGGSMGPTTGSVATFSTDEFWSLDTVARRTWQQIPSVAPSAGRRQGHTASLVGTNMIILGGEGETGDIIDMHTVYIFDTSSKAWSHTTASGEIPVPRYGHSAVVFGDKIIVYGGRSLVNNTILSDVAVLDTTSWDWEKPSVDNVPPARYEHTATLLGSQMIVAFGNLGAEVDDQIFILDTKSWSWTNKFDVSSADDKPPVSDGGETAENGEESSTTDRSAEGKTNRTNNTAIIMGSIAGVVVLVALASVLILLYRYRQRRRNTYNRKHVQLSNSRLVDPEPGRNSFNSDKGIRVTSVVRQTLEPSPLSTPSIPGTPARNSQHNSTTGLFLGVDLNIGFSDTNQVGVPPSPASSSVHNVDLTRERDSIRESLSRFSDGPGSSSDTLDRLDGIAGSRQDNSGYPSGD